MDVCQIFRIQGTYFKVLTPAVPLQGKIKK